MLSCALFSVNRFLHIWPKEVFMMDIQMAAGANRDPDSRSGFTIEKVQQFLRLVHVAWASVMGMIILVGIVAFVILMMIHERSTWVVWFLLSMFASLCWCFQQLWSQFWHAIHVGCNVQLHVQSSGKNKYCLLYTSPSPRDVEESRMPSSA